MWNIDLTLVDVARVSRDAYAEAFQRTTGRRLVALPQLAGATDSEIFFESLAINEVVSEANDQLAHYHAELAAAFGSRAGLLAERGRLLPGALESLAAVSRLPGAIQTVLTGTIKPNAVHKLRAFGLDRYLDTEIGGFGSDVYPKGTQILRSLAKSEEKYGIKLTSGDVVYVGDSTRDVAAAKVAAVRCVGVATGRSTAAELKEAGAYPVLDDLSVTTRVVAAVSP
ncbi:MAG TPA: haloacid dehalogenase-like hydrolase [Streptosporangiaceae bacterium]|nr:haloacid dehalogenase-like hydrolase [Streptosporangiaceae bacterium]